MYVIYLGRRCISHANQQKDDYDHILVGYRYTNRVLLAIGSRGSRQRVMFVWLYRTNMLILFIIYLFSASI